MKSTEKIWHDENSEPPKNYIWAKNGKLFKYINGQWKEISKNNSGCDCPGAMFVHGTVSEDSPYKFVPNSGEPSSSDAMKHIENGGILYIVFSPTDGIEFTASLTIIQTVGDTTLLGFMINADHIAFWQYEPDPDFSVSVDFNNPDIGETNELKIWFTQLGESTIEDAEVCGLFIDNYSYSHAILSKQADGLFVSETSMNWGLASREFVLSEDSSLAIPETVKYVVVYKTTPS